LSQKNRKNTSFPLSLPSASPSIEPLLGIARPIVTLPDACLRQMSEPVTVFNADLQALVADMFASMYEANGIGLAAVQIGVLQRVVVIDLRERTQNEDGTISVTGHLPQTFINPRVLEVSEERSSYEEGCLSIPDFHDTIERPARVTVAYQDVSGHDHTIEADGLLATCLQHEIDHLNGVLFIDSLSRLKRDRVITKFKKAARKNA
jgi:peptide deformylase